MSVHQSQWWHCGDAHRHQGMSQAMWLTLLVKASESAMRQGMQLAGVTHHHLAPMAGRVLKLEIIDLKTDLWLICGESQWWLATSDQGVADVTLTGSLGALVETARSMTDPNSALVLEGLEVRGSVGVLQTLQRLLRDLDLDWQDALSQAIGPIPANLIIRTLRAAREQLITSQALAKRQLQDTLQAEHSPVIPETTYQGTKDRVTALSRQLERMDARLRRLEHAQ